MEWTFDEEAHITALVQLILGLLLCGRAIVVLCKGKNHDHHSESESESEAEDEQQGCLAAKGESGAEWTKFTTRQHKLKNTQRAKSIFCGHFRDEENFVRGNTDPQVVLPPSSPMEIDPPFHSRRVLYLLPLKDEILRNTLVGCLGCAFLSGSVASYLCTMDRNSDVGERGWWKYGNVLGHLLSDYKWLPTLLLGSHLGFYLLRWRQFMFAAWGVEGRLKDMGICLGMDVVDPSNPASRSVMFKIYRYMILVMALQYKIAIPALKKLGTKLPQGLVDLGLLTPEELVVLVPAGTRMRDTVICWISREVKLNGPSGTGLLSGRSENAFLFKLAEMRGSMMYFHGNNYLPGSNLRASVLKCLIDSYCALMMVAYPFKQLVPHRYTWPPGFQPVVVLTVFAMMSSFRTIEVLSYALATPMNELERVDTYDIDALIAGTEQTLFATLRTSFDDKTRKSSAQLIKGKIPNNLAFVL